MFSAEVKMQPVVISVRDCATRIWDYVCRRHVVFCDADEFQKMKNTMMFQGIAGALRTARTCDSADFEDAFCSGFLRRFHAEVAKLPNEYDWQREILSDIENIVREVEALYVNYDDLKLAVNSPSWNVDREVRQQDDFPYDGFGFTGDIRAFLAEMEGLEAALFYPVSFNKFEEMVRRILRYTADIDSDQKSHAFLKKINGLLLKIRADFVSALGKDSDNEIVFQMYGQAGCRYDDIGEFFVSKYIIEEFRAAVSGGDGLVYRKLLDFLSSFNAHGYTDPFPLVLVYQGAVLPSKFMFELEKFLEIHIKDSSLKRLIVSVCNNVSSSIVSEIAPVGVNNLRDLRNSSDFNHTEEFTDRITSILDRYPDCDDKDLMRGFLNQFVPRDVTENAA